MWERAGSVLISKFIIDLSKKTIRNRSDNAVKYLRSYSFEQLEQAYK